MTDEEISAYVRESRRAQGLPEKIEDPVALARVAAILRESAQKR